MKLKTVEFKEAANTILPAVDLDKNAANLEVAVKENNLYLTVTNKEYYVSVKFPAENTQNFRAVVDATQFLKLISEINTEDFEIIQNNNSIIVKTGKSKYTIPMIYENDTMLALQPIIINNKTVEMTIQNEILRSILNVNSKELLKVKNIEVNELQKLYYIDETGCFTFTTGACLNKFTLEKPVKMLLNDRVVKLFKLFKTDVKFSLGYDAISASGTQTKVSFETENIYMAAIIACNDILLSKIQGPCNATNALLTENYPIKAVISTNELSGAISRIINFTKNGADAANSKYVLPVTVVFSANEINLHDNFGNEEIINYENGSYVGADYTMVINGLDLKLVLDSYRNDHVTLNCGNGKSVVITHININHFLPEAVK